MLTRLRAVLVLGRVALNGFRKGLEHRGICPEESAVPFGHGNAFDLGPGLPRLFISFHPSRQNTQTGRLTPQMLDRVLKDIRSYLDASDERPVLRKFRIG